LTSRCLPKGLEHVGDRMRRRWNAVVGIDRGVWSEARQ
jgi:hypothetical protein